MVQLLLERGADKEAKCKARSPPTARCGVGARAHLQLPRSRPLLAFRGREAGGAVRASTCARLHCLTCPFCATPQNGKTPLDWAKNDAVLALLRGSGSSGAAAQAAAAPAAAAAKCEADTAAAREAADAASAAERAKQQAEADAAAAQRVAAAEQQARVEAEARKAAEARASALERELAVAREAAANAAAAAAAVPSDVAALLSRLSLSHHGAALVDVLGVASCADVSLLTEAMLKEELPAMKPIERARLLAAAAKLGGDGKAAVAAAPAEAAAPAGARWS